MSRKNSPRIVFMGTPDFAVTILDTLVENDYNIVGVITAPDKPAGRGRKLKSSAVKNYAIEKGLSVMQPTKLRDESFLEELASLQPDLQIVVAFRMLPKVVWDLPKLGTFNLHASLLPDYRGAAPIHWSIINGETKTGVTTFFIDDKIDTGEIIASKEITIGKEETVGTLHDKLMYLGAELVCETVDAISENNVQTTKQPAAINKFAPKLTPENTKIDWELPLEHIYNKIRGLNPFPAAWTSIENNNETTSAKIYKVSTEFRPQDLPNGTIVIDQKSLKVAVKGGFLIIEEIKLSGKRKMPIRDLLNGYSFSEDSKMF